MKNLHFRHGVINKQDFLFSLKECNDEAYLAAYSLVKNLLVGMAKRARLYCSNRYDFADYPFCYRERQLDSILLPELSTLCKGYVFAEYPVTRNSRKYEAKDSKGRIDYWCIYKDYSFVIEVKHSYDNFTSGKTKDETIGRWELMNKYQLRSIKKYIKRNYIEKTKGVIPLALHFVTSEFGGEPTNERRNEYIEQERMMLKRLHDDLTKIEEPDFMSLWEIDKEMYKKSQFDGYSYPGLILVSKSYEVIKHKGAEKYGK